MTSPGPAGNARAPHSVGVVHAWRAPDSQRRAIPRTPEDILQLNSCLRGELSAVETYARCIARNEEAALNETFASIKESHARRVRLLVERIVTLGGHPADTSGAWGFCTRLVERGVHFCGGISGTLRVLKAVERHGMADYRRAMRQLSPGAREFIVNEILPEQRYTENSLLLVRSQYRTPEH